MERKEGICGAGAVALHCLGQQGAPAAPSRGPAAADRTLGKFRPRGASQPRGPGQDTAALGAAPPSPAVGSAQYPLPAAAPGPRTHSSLSAQEGCSHPQGGASSLGSSLQWGVFIAQGEAWSPQDRRQLLQTHRMSLQGA